MPSTTTPASSVRIPLLSDLLESIGEHLTDVATDLSDVLEQASLVVIESLREAWWSRASWRSSAQPAWRHEADTLESPLLMLYALARPDDTATVVSEPVTDVASTADAAEPGAALEEELALGRRQMEWMIG